MYDMEIINQAIDEVIADGSLTMERANELLAMTEKEKIAWYKKHIEEEL